MPRTTMRRKHYMFTDLVSTIAAKLQITKITRIQLAQHLGITTVSLRKKMNGETEFTRAELIELYEYLGFTDSEILKVNKV